MADEGRHHQGSSNSGSHRDEVSRSSSHQHHFLIVVFGIQSHINPARALAHRLTRLGVRATLCLSVATHRRMFPDGGAEEEATDGVVSYVPYTDGLDDKGTLPRDDDERARSRRVGCESISSVVGRLAARGQPAVTCLMCTMVVPAALDAASQLGVPLAVYWIQPAHVLACYYHYFHGYADLVASRAADPAAREVSVVSLPGLSRPLRVRDLPSFLVDTTGSKLTRTINEAMRELFEYVDRRRPKLLVNTFDELEPAALAEMSRRMDVFAVGPMVGSHQAEARLLHLFRHDDVDRKRYMDWLGAQPEKSVVYLSFGSIWKYKRRQMEEIVQGLKRCGRPYLLVVRKDGLELDDEDTNTMLGRILLETTTTTTTAAAQNKQQQQQGMVVEWCNQPEVLSHASVGCFVTHCGWNSTLEAVVSGVPIVAVPNMFDQPTTAYLVEEEWLIGARVERDSEGILTATKLARCIELVMGAGDGAKASSVVIRKRTEALKRVAREAAGAGGRAERNLIDFVKTV